MTTRRHFLLLACAAAASPARAQVPPNIAAQRKAALDAAIREVTGGAPLQSGRVKLEVPPLVDNGNTVPLAVTVASPMTEADHVKAIHVFTEKNPQPNVLSAYFGPRSGAARFATRIRLADTQTVIAVAELSDGSFWSGSASVIVTLAACLEEL